MEGTPRGTDLPPVPKPERDDSRRELLDLARGVAAGKIRPELADSIVPVTASEFAPCPLATFALLVEAVGSGRPVEPLLNSLMNEAAA